MSPSDADVVVGIVMLVGVTAVVWVVAILLDLYDSMD